MASYFSAHGERTNSSIVEQIRVLNPKCCLCDRPTEEIHHNTYIRYRYERPTDVAPLCSACHARHEWFRKYGSDFIEWLRQIRKRHRTNQVRIKEVGNYINERVKSRLERMIDEVDCELGILESIDEPNYFRSDCA